MRATSIQWVTSGNMNADISSRGIFMNQIINASVQAIWTGAGALGTIKLQVSNDNVQVAQGTDPGANVVNWSDYSGTDQDVAGAGSFFWNLSDVGYQWLRIKFVKTGGSAGTLNSTVCVKGI